VDLFGKCFDKRIKFKIRATINNMVAFNLSTKRQDGFAYYGLLWKKIKMLVKK